jgi:hypothetical protein
MTRISIKGVNGTGTNLKRTTEKTDNPRNHKNALIKNRLILLWNVSEFFFMGCFGFLDVIFVAIIGCLLIFINIKKYFRFQN